MILQNVICVLTYSIPSDCSEPSPIVAISIRWFPSIFCWWFSGIAKEKHDPNHTMLLRGDSSCSRLAPIWPTQIILWTNTKNRFLLLSDALLTCCSILFPSQAVSTAAFHLIKVNGREEVEIVAHSTCIAYEERSWNWEIGGQLPSALHIK